jgi:hemoglobin-like flavoprotein
MSLPQEPRKLRVLSEAQLSLIKKTLPLFEKNSYNIAVEMYSEVFKVDINIRNLFSHEFMRPNSLQSKCPFQSEQTLSEPLSPQARVLSQTIVTLASNIESIHLQDDIIDRIGCKHVSRDVRPGHYPVVAQAFSKAMISVLGSSISKEEHDAWNASVRELADVFIKHEEEVRERAKSKRGVSAKHPYPWGILFSILLNRLANILNSVFVSVTILVLKTLQCTFLTDQTPAGMGRF